jgi:hypothetical protein
VFVQGSAISAKQEDTIRVILDFRCEVEANRGLLICYTACSGNSFPTFWDNTSVPFSRVINSRKTEEASGPNPKRKNKKNMMMTMMMKIKIKKKKKNQKGIPEDFSETENKHMRGC